MATKQRRWWQRPLLLEKIAWSFIKQAYQLFSVLVLLVHLLSGVSIGRILNREKTPDQAWTSMANSRYITFCTFLELLPYLGQVFHDRIIVFSRATSMNAAREEEVVSGRPEKEKNSPQGGRKDNNQNWKFGRRKRKREGDQKVEREKGKKSNWGRKKGRKASRENSLTFWLSSPDETF